MARMIDADYAKDALHYIPWINPKETDDCIDKCPTVEVPHWIPVEERMPELIPCNAGSAYSEAVIALTDNCKVLTAILSEYGWICDDAFWDAEEEEILYWMPVPPLPKPLVNGERIATPDAPLGMTYGGGEQHDAC